MGQSIRVQEKEKTNQPQGWQIIKIITLQSLLQLVGITKYPQLEE